MPEVSPLALTLRHSCQSTLYFLADDWQERPCLSHSRGNSSEPPGNPPVIGSNANLPLEPFRSSIVPHLNSHHSRRLARQGLPQGLGKLPSTKSSFSKLHRLLSARVFVDRSSRASRAVFLSLKFCPSLFRPVHSTLSLAFSVADVINQWSSPQRWSPQLLARSSCRI